MIQLQEIYKKKEFSQYSELNRIKCYVSVIASNYASVLFGVTSHYETTIVRRLN